MLCRCGALPKWVYFDIFFLSVILTSARTDTPRPHPSQEGIVVAVSGHTYSSAVRFSIGLVVYMCYRGNGRITGERTGGKVIEYSGFCPTVIKQAS